MHEPSLAVLAAIAVRTSIVFVALVVGFRLLGKRGIGELNLYDLMVILMVANAVQNSMAASLGSVSVAVVAASVLLVMSWAIAKVFVRHPWIEQQTMGAPAVLAQDGQLIGSTLRREHVDADDVMTAVREQGLDDLKDVKVAVLEVDGTISVVPKEEARKDLNA